jgi:hypothetical protein
MDYMGMLITISSLTVSEYKQMTKALRVLLAVGMDRASALDIILRGIENKKHNQSTINSPVAVKR